MSDIPETPADPKTAASYRVMKAVVIILGVLIVIALGAVVVGLATRASGHKGAAAAAKDGAPAEPVSMTIAPGYSILSMDTQPGRLILRVRSATQDEIDIIDLKDGRVVSRIHAALPK